ncbi:MAG: tRNA-specific adenosine deaminase [Bacteroidetes bacterium HGW-Bacteroidetes-19]|nr:MAG: tRNA-specific adenosine deaminase [Bacteroidetes bacterium HGW-Bacteroidetes-20]PKP27868.1 MAG: tRNA-specific adenosine deaminase [Bacteroidetes bacterium HGW-Bacteroidetes-19]
MTHEDYMKEAFKEAFQGMRNNEGGPFGAVVVINGTIVGRGHNRVTSTNDPTAHAEVVAIRNACQALGVFHLPEATIYATSEPCPMCLSAIYWTNIKNVFYCTDKFQVEKIGFSDKFIYDEFALPKENRSIHIDKIDLSEGIDLFYEWMTKIDKTNY